MISRRRPVELNKIFDIIASRFNRFDECRPIKIQDIRVYEIKTHRSRFSRNIFVFHSKSHNFLINNVDKKKKKNVPLPVARFKTISLAGRIHYADSVSRLVEIVSDPEPASGPIRSRKDRVCTAHTRLPPCNIFNITLTGTRYRACFRGRVGADRRGGGGDGDERRDPGATGGGCGDGRWNFSDTAQKMAVDARKYRFILMDYYYRGRRSPFDPRGFPTARTLYVRMYTCVYGTRIRGAHPRVVRAKRERRVVCVTPARDKERIARPSS